MITLLGNMWTDQVLYIKVAKHLYELIDTNLSMKLSDSN